MKKSFCFIVPLLLCWVSLGSAANDPPPRLRIGVIAPLSGPAAEYGVAIQNAFELQAKDQTGRSSDVEFVFEDTPYNARSAVDSFSRLRNVEHVDLIYVWGVVFCEAVAPLAEQFKVPMIAQCVQPGVTKNRASVVRFANPAGDYTAKIWEHLRSKQLRRIAVVMTDNSYLQLMADALSSGKRPDESLLIIDRFQAPQTDFRGTVAKLKSGRFDAVAVLLGPGQIGPFYRQLAEQQLSLPTVGTNLFESSGEISAGGAGIDGAVLANNSVNADFAERYQKEYGNLSQITFAAYAYDFAKIARSFAARYDGVREHVLEEFVRNPPPTGVCGKIRLVQDPGGGLSFTFPVVLKTIHNGSLATL